MKKRLAILTLLIFTLSELVAQVNLLNTFGDKKHSVITSAISYDGTKMVTAGDDNELIVWDLQAGNVYRRLTGLTEWTKSLAFSRDGKLIASGGKDGKVHIWDIDRSTRIYSLSGHSGDVNAVCFCTDNSIVASGGADKSIKIWDAQTGRLLHTLSGHSKDVNSIDYCPSGTRFATASADGSVIVWNTLTLKQEVTINEHKGWVRSVAFSPDGSSIASCGDDKQIVICDVMGNVKNSLKGHKDRIQTVSYSPDGKYLVSGSHDQTFIVWDAQTGSQIYQSPSQGMIVYSVGFNPDGRSILATKFRKDELVQWDVSSLNISGRLIASSAAVKTKPVEQPIITQSVESFETPQLQLRSILLVDPNHNNIIDAGEESALAVTLVNAGKGSAHDVKLFIVEKNNVKGLSFSSLHALGEIPPGVEKKYNIPISATEQVLTGSANFNVSITEGRGYNGNPLELAIATKKLELPMVVLHEHAFLPVNSDKITKGSVFKLSMIVQNKGDAIAYNINVKFQLPENTYIISDNEFTIPQLSPTEYKALDIEVMTNTRYIRPDIPIEIFITESTGKFGDRKIASARLDEGPQGNYNSPMLAITPRNTPSISSQPVAEVQAQPSLALSDVDVDIPLIGKPDPNRYALIIGNEDYSSYQKGLKTEANVEFAVHDAEVFKDYALKILRIPKDNIIFRANATAMEMHRVLSMINTIAKINEGRAEIFVMYAGHGFPDEKTQEPYLIPVDVSGADLQFAIKLSEFYGKLTEHPTKRVTVFLDACFSGGGRDQGLIAARGVRVRPKENALCGNLVVFAATSGDQSALPWRDKGHGMFTYHLLQKLKETKGEISYGDLSEFLRTTVGTRSVIINQKEQNPQTNVSGDVVETWTSWKFK